MKILAFDPGGTTGVCGWHDTEGITMTAQLDIENHHLILLNLLDLIMPDVVIYETFEYRGGKAHVDLIPVEYIGVIKLWQQTHSDTILEPQSPNYGKAFWSDPKLKMTGLYEPGHPHSNDATRHMLQYITFRLNDQSYLHMLSTG